MTALHSIVALAAVAMGALPALAQPVYKCGSTYSQTPCDAAAKPSAAVSKAAPAPVQQPGGAIVGSELCAVGLARQLGFPDPASAGIHAVEKAPAEVIQYKGAPLVAHKYIVNSRSRLYACYLSEDERRLLSVDAPSLRTAGGSGASGLSRDPRVEREETLRQAAEAAEKKRRAEELAEARVRLRARQGLLPP